MEFILHIGHPKCGSSSIQDFFVQNWQFFLKEKVGYVDFDFRVFHKKSSPNPPVNFLKRFKGGDVSEAEFRERLEYLLKQGRRAGLRKLILSAENLSDIFYPTYFKSYLPSDVRVKVVYYIRRPDDWVLSAWKQWQVKQGHTLQQFVDHNLASPIEFYRPVLRTWMTAFPEADFFVRWMHKSTLYNKDLIADFCHCASLNIENKQMVEKRNPSLDYDLLHFFSQHPEIFDSPHDNFPFHILEKYLGAEVYSDHNLDPLGYDNRQALLKKHAAEIDWFIEHFFPDVDRNLILAVKNKKTSEDANEIKNLSKIQAIIFKLLMQSLKKS